jgi:hypothetical protein
MEHLIGVAVCAIWAFIGYIVGLDEGMSRNAK